MSFVVADRDKRGDKGGIGRNRNSNESKAFYVKSS